MRKKMTSPHAAAEAPTRQELFINQNLAYQALGDADTTAEARIFVVSRRFLQPGNWAACAVADQADHGLSLT
jgi:hypothetical protein